MELKYLVVQLEDFSSLFETLFEFKQAETAIEVCQQLNDKNDYYRYEVIVRYA